MRLMQDKKQLFACVTNAGAVAGCGGYSVAVWSKDKLLTTQATDNKGRVHLEFDAPSPWENVELRVLAPWGT